MIPCRGSYFYLKLTDLRRFVREIQVNSKRTQNPFVFSLFSMAVAAKINQPYNLGAVDI